MKQESPFYRFPEGLPAFEQHCSFRLVREAEFDPLLFLVSESDPALRFICIQVRFIAPAYSYELDESGAEVLGVPPGRYDAADAQFGCLAILSFPSEAPATANLLAPVVIHYGNRTGLQAVQMGGVWSHAQTVGIVEGA